MCAFASRIPELRLSVNKAARELTDALLINPYDTGQTAAAIRSALDPEWISCA